MYLLFSTVTNFPFAFIVFKIESEKAVSGFQVVLGSGWTTKGLNNVQIRSEKKAGKKKPISTLSELRH